MKDKSFNKSQMNTELSNLTEESDDDAVGENAKKLVMNIHLFLLGRNIKRRKHINNKQYFQECNAHE